MWWIIGIICVIGLIKWFSYKDNQEIRRKAAQEYLDEARQSFSDDEEIAEEDETVDDDEPATYDAEHRDVSVMLILLCLDKHDDLDERLVYGCWNAMDRFFVNDSASFSPTIDRIKKDINIVDEEKVIENAALVLTDEEKQYCFDVCEDIYHYDNGYGNNEEMLNFNMDMALAFNLDIEAQKERQKTFEIKKDVEFKTYKSAEQGFSIRAPKSWIVQDNQNDLIKIIIRRNNLNTIEVLAQNINVTSENAQQMNLNSYMEASKAYMAKSLKNFNIYYEGNFGFKNGPGYQMDYSFESEGLGEMNNKSYIFLYNNIAYIITGVATDNSADDYKKIFEESAKSFVLENLTGTKSY